jgi:elongation factor G
MKEYKTESIRNVALVSHSSAGKTMLAEAFLHFSGATTRLGKVEDGTTISDFEDEEIRRGISLSTAVIPVEHKNHKINFLDTPGYNDFIGEMISALRVTPIQLPWGEKQDFKGVIDLLTMKAYPGDGKTATDIPPELNEEAEAARNELIEAAAEGEDELLMKYLEGETLDAQEIKRGLAGVFRARSYVPVFVVAGSAEIGIAPLLDAVVDLMPSPSEVPTVVAKGKDGDEELTASDSGPLGVYVWKTTADPFVGKITYLRVYSGMLTSDTRVWNQTKETEERFGNLNLLRGKEAIPVKTVHAGDIASVPKLSATSTGDTLCDRAHPLELPIPDYPTALYRVALTPKTQADAAKISPTLTRLCEEDMTLSWHQEPSTNQSILQGMGDQHINVAIRKAESKFQTGLNTEEPRVPYRETITRLGSAQYRHKKQTGGAGQFAEVHLRVDPLKEGNFEFVNKVFGGSISNNYMPAIEKGIRRVMEKGVVAGYPVEKVKVEVFDGKEHPVDSKPVAFEIAGREAFKLAVKDAGPVMLEPIMNVEITVPEANMGDILGDLNTRRARVQGMDTAKRRSVVTAQVPLAEMQRYTTDLRSMTGGRGIFSMEFGFYEKVPTHITQELIDTRQKELAAQKEE